MRRSLLAIPFAAAVLASAPARADLPGEGYRNHLVISLGVGFDTLNPKDYDAYTDAFNQHNGGQAGQAHPSIAIHASLALTYYAPYYILVRSGVEPDYFFPTEKIGGETVTNYGGTLEIPIFVGGHYAFLDNRLIVELAVGPAIAAFTTAGLNGSNGVASGDQLYADPSVGFDSQLKGQFFVSSTFSLGLEVGYRILSSSSLHQSGGSTYYQPPGFGDGKPIHLDFSGFRLAFEVGFAVL